MKILLTLSFTLAFCLQLTAQNPHTRSMNVYAGLWQIGAANSGNNAAGIQHRIRQSPFILGLDFTQHWHKRWHYYISLQASKHYITSNTAFSSPQPLQGGVVRLELAHDDFVAWQVMAGGGAQYYLLEQKEFRLRLSAGMFGAYTPKREVQGKGIYLSNAVGDDYETGGEVQHRVIQQWVPVGRVGIGAQYLPLFAKTMSRNLLF